MWLCFKERIVFYNLSDPFGRTLMWLCVREGIVVNNLSDPFILDGSRLINVDLVTAKFTGSPTFN